MLMIKYKQDSMKDKKYKTLMLLLISLSIVLIQIGCGSEKAEEETSDEVVKLEEVPIKQIPLDYIVELSRKGFEVKSGECPPPFKNNTVLKIPKSAKVKIVFKKLKKIKIKIEKGKDKGKFSPYKKKEYIWKDAEGKLFIKSGKKIFEIHAR